MKAGIPIFAVVCCLASLAGGNYAEAKQEPKFKYRWVLQDRPLTDFPGNDIASTSGNTPKRKVKGNILCDAGHEDFIASCFKNRPDGFPALASDKTDIVGTPHTWCAYKNNPPFNKDSTGTDNGIRGSTWVCQRVRKK